MCVCLSVRNTFIPNELLVTKVTENDQVRVSISSEPSWCQRQSVCSWRTSIAGVENFYFLSDIFDFMLDFIPTEARLLHMLDSLLLLWYPCHPRAGQRAGHWAGSACPTHSYTYGLKRYLTHWPSIQLDLSYFPWLNSISQYSISSFWWSISFILHGSISQYSISDKREKALLISFMFWLNELPCYIIFTSGCTPLAGYKMAAEPKKTISRYSG